MFSTTWLVKDETNKLEMRVKYYHFKREPQFPPHFLEESNSYQIEMLWNNKLILKPLIFCKCLFHDCIIDDVEVIA